jgi:hypothetical protein
MWTLRFVVTNTLSLYPILPTFSSQQIDFRFEAQSEETQNKAASFVVYTLLNWLSAGAMETYA